MNFSFSSSLTYTFCMLFLKSMSLKVGSSFSYSEQTKPSLGRSNTSRKVKRSKGCYPLFVTGFTVHQGTLQVVLPVDH